MQLGQIQITSTNLFDDKKFLTFELDSNATVSEVPTAAILGQHVLHDDLLLLLSRPLGKSAALLFSRHIRKHRCPDLKR